MTGMRMSLMIKSLLQDLSFSSASAAFAAD